MGLATGWTTWIAGGRRGLWLLAAAAGSVLGLWTYDALAYRQLEQTTAQHTDNPAAVLREWESFQTWHPTRRLFGVVSAATEEERLHTLRQAARQQEWSAQLANLRREADAAETDPEQTWQQFKQVRTAFPEMSTTDDLARIQAVVQARHAEHVSRQARVAHEELVRAEEQGLTLTALLAQADRYLKEFPGSAHEDDVRRRRATIALRLDERDFEPARELSARQPLAFQARRERYLSYLERHPNGTFAKEATAALKTIAADWDRHDFRAVRDHFTSKPGQTAELVTRCRSYLATHPEGRFTAAARDLLRWTERVTAPGEYRVTLRSGQVENGLVRFFSRGPDLSVEVEVNGVRHGPSPVVKNRYDPDWDYEFPRRIRWKLGDPVRIRVMDHDWKDRVVLEIASADGDPLTMRLLSGEVWSGQNWLRFESDFAMPVLPKIE